MENLSDKEKSGLVNDGKGDIKFSTDGDKICLHLKENGDILVNDKLIENDKEIIDGLRDFITSAKLTLTKSGE